jgi:PhnB protein
MIDQESPTSVESSVTPWLSVADGASALRFYKAAFGAEDHCCMEDRTGSVLVAQLAVGETDFWIQESPGAHPDPCRGHVRVALAVSDPEAMMRQAIAAGAIEIAPISIDESWRGGRLVDPFGHHWLVSELRPK